MEVSLVAAAIQFIDIGGRSLLLFSEILSKLKDAPTKISLLQRDIQILCQLCQDIRTDPTTTGLNSLPLSDVLQQVVCLESLLGEFTVIPGDNFGRKTLKAVLSVKNARRLDYLSERLEHAKLTLIVWYERHREIALKKIDNETSVTEAKIHDLTILSHEAKCQLEKASDDLRQNAVAISKLDANNASVSIILQQAIAPKVEQIESQTCELVGNVGQSLSLGHSLEARVADIGRGINGQLIPLVRDLGRRIDANLSRPLFDMKDLFENFDMMWSNEMYRREAIPRIHPPNSNLQRHFASKPAELRSPGSNYSQQSTIARPPHRRLHDSGRKNSRITKKRLCSCVPISWFASLIKMRNFAIDYRCREEHAKGCYLHPASRTRRAITMRAVIDSKWLWQFLEWSVSVTIGDGGFAISPTINTYRLVDRRRSPAFRLIDELDEDLEEIRALAKHAEDIEANLSLTSDLQLLASSLQIIRQRQIEFFNDGFASPYDIDKQGNNLLHAVFKLLFKIIEIVIRRMHYRHTAFEDSIGALVDLISFFAALELNSCGLNDDGLTPFGRFVDDLGYVCYPKRPNSLEKSFLESVVNRLCCQQESPLQANTDYLCFVPPESLKILHRQIPDIIECTGHTPLAAALLMKDETEVRRLLDSGADRLSSKQNRYRKLEIAGYWAKGFQLLLEASALTDETMFTGAPTSLDPQIFTLILDAGGPLYPPKDLLKVDGSHGSFTILELFLICHECDPSVWRRMAQTLSQRRQDLAILARHHLPIGHLEELKHRCNGNVEGLLDRCAVPTAEAMELYGFTVPAKLSPYGRCSVYDFGYHSFSMELYVTEDQADVLYEVGFRDLDVPNAYGFTPLHAFCFRKNVGMAFWLLEHGADFTSSPEGLSCSCLHLFAEGLSFQQGPLALSVDQTLLGRNFDSSCNLMSQLISIFGLFSTDACRYCCSEAGCTVVSMMFRKSGRNWYDKLFFLENWCDTLQLSDWELEVCCKEFARIEVFERLGITHVCCDLEKAAVGDLQMPEEDQTDIMEEEELMIGELDEWIDFYGRERLSFKGSPIAFLGKFSACLRQSGLDQPEHYQKHWEYSFGYYERARRDDAIQIFKETRFIFPGF